MRTRIASFSLAARTRSHRALRVPRLRARSAGAGLDEAGGVQTAELP